MGEKERNMDVVEYYMCELKSLHKFVNRSNN